MRSDDLSPGGYLGLTAAASQSRVEHRGGHDPFWTSLHAGGPTSAPCVS